MNAFKTNYDLCYKKYKMKNVMNCVYKMFKIVNSENYWVNVAAYYY